MKPWFALFVAGWLANSASRSLQQDMMGKEKSLAMYEAAWVSPMYTVPIAIVILWFVWVLVKHARRELGQ